MPTPCPMIVINADDGCDEMKELLTIALWDVSVLDKVNDFLKLGLPTFVPVKTNRVVTEGTDKIFTLYKLADPLHDLLLAVRTGNVQPEITK